MARTLLLVSMFADLPLLIRIDMKTDFWSVGHKPTLFAAFLYFDLSFMVWVLLGPLAVQISADLQLTAAQKGMMVATPILSGAILRMLMGILVDHLQPKKAGLLG